MFVSGTLVIDAPASALNNSGERILGAWTENTSSVKFIRTNDGKTYPYVSAQAFRYWLRSALSTDDNWEMSEIFREDKVAYTDANPIRWWDDDLFGYMRAPSKKGGKEATEALPTGQEQVKGSFKALTRSAPFRVSTLVSIAPANIVNDYGTMTRQEGDPVPFEHQFYRATLNALMSLDLSMAGKFFYKRRTGYQNLDTIRRQEAEEKGLEHLKDEMAYRLPQADRIQRIGALLNGLTRIEGGAKQAMHYTDVTPAVSVFAVIKGGNHPFNYLFKESRGECQIQLSVLENALTDCKQELISPVFVGWKHGYLPPQRELVEQFTVKDIDIAFSTPRTAFERLTEWIAANPDTWDT